MSKQPGIEITDLRFSYSESGFSLTVPELNLAQGERAAVVGPSGSGKTTLLSLIAGILPAESGELTVAGQRLTHLSETGRRNFRIRNVGFIFQAFELIDYLDVAGNVLLPYRINRSLKLDQAARDRARDLIASVGLSGKERRPVSRLSQGEKQRVAICRALSAEPKLILADEPTGNLDPANKDRILGILFERAHAAGATLLTVTHDHSLLSGFDRTIDFQEFLA